MLILTEIHPSRTALTRMLPHLRLLVRTLKSEVPAVQLNIHIRSLSHLSINQYPQPIRQLRYRLRSTPLTQLRIMFHHYSIHLPTPNLYPRPLPREITNIMMTNRSRRLLRLLVRHTLQGHGLNNKSPPKTLHIPVVHETNPHLSNMKFGSRQIFHPHRSRLKNCQKFTKESIR